MARIVKVEQLRPPGAGPEPTLRNREESEGPAPGGRLTPGEPAAGYGPITPVARIAQRTRKSRQSVSENR